MSGPILFVGEGNFSFSAALCQLSPENQVTATCLQRQEDVKHEGASANIQIIRSSGGTVLFGVDCTKLEQCASLQGVVFKRVIFNFPHCGRKSGVKKNRELLQNFFLSCVQVLDERGDVHVTLCNGQGGTPADQPMREWQNSWQVVAMAAEADLILSSVQPFRREQMESYKCTGYRSQDKGFHVENALVHVFTCSPPYITPVKVIMKETLGDQRVQYYVPTELSDFMSRDFLCSGSLHPVKLVQDYVVKGLEEKCCVTMMTKPLHFLLNSKQLQAASLDGDHITPFYEIQLLHTEPLAQTEPLVHEPELRDQSAYSDAKEKQRDTIEYDAHRPYLETTDVHRPDLDLIVGLLSGVSVSVTADVHKLNKATPDIPKSDGEKPGVHRPEGSAGVFVLRPSLLPQMEEMMVRPGEARDRGKPDTGESVPIEEPSERSHCAVNPGAAIHNLLGISGLVFRDVPINPWAPPAFHQLLLRGRFPAASQPIALLRQTLEQLFSSHGISVVTEDGSLRLLAQPMGAVGRVFASAAHCADGWVLVNLSFNLDLLAAHLFSLQDWRLLWTRDPGFSKCFVAGVPQHKPSLPLFAPSLFARRHSFDVSFWTGPSAWDDRKLRALVREACLGTAEQVELIDSFTRQEQPMLRSSRCYRVSYLSHSHALSHRKAYEMHRRLESLLSSVLHVTIR